MTVGSEDQENAVIHRHRETYGIQVEIENVQTRDVAGDVRVNGGIDVRVDA